MLKPNRRRRVLPIGRRLFQTKSSMRRQPSWNGLPASRKIMRSRWWQLPPPTRSGLLPRPSAPFKRRSRIRASFEKHEAETEEQIGRLEQVFAAIEKKPQAKTCDAIVGITEEGAEIMKEYKGSPALDAGL